MAYAPVNGLQLYYETHGSGRPLVLLHGGLLTIDLNFGPLLEPLAASRHVIAVELQGHGHTADSGRPMTIEALAGDVVALLDQLGVERAVLAGMSQGGFLSLRAALTAPDRVRALVLIDSQAGLEDPAVAPGYEQMHQAWLEHGPGPVQEVVASIILGPGQWDGWYAKWNEQYAQWAPDDLGQLTWPFRCLMDRDDLTGRLAGITCPALVVHGTADAAIPVGRAEAVRDGLGGLVTFTLVDGAPHASNVTYPDEVNRAILGFMSGLDAG